MLGKKLMDHLPNRYARSFDIYGVDECVKVVLVGWVPWNGSFGDSFLNLGIVRKSKSLVFGPYLESGISTNRPVRFRCSRPFSREKLDRVPLGLCSLELRVLVSGNADSAAEFGESDRNCIVDCDFASIRDG